jgi:hypothetical protein
METNKMKKIIVFKLWKHSSKYKIRSIHLGDKWFGRIWMSQEWASREEGFKFNFLKLVQNKSNMSFMLF